VRLEFGAEDPAAFDVLKLSVRYDDGFVAYLNGVEVARRNAPDNLDATSAAASDRPDAAAFDPEEIYITQHLELLHPDRNVLAIQALNASKNDERFLILPELVGLVVEEGTERYFPTPTPGRPNSGEGLEGFVADTKFSVDRGFYSGPFDMQITTATPGATIRFTTDGSAPGPSSGTVYSGPIHVSTTTTLRAAAFRAGLGPTNVDAQTYIFPADVVRQTGAGQPTSWGGTPADYEMDPNVTANDKYKDTIETDIVEKIPTLSIVLPTADIFGPSGLYSNTEGRGDSWERACSAELIYPDGSPGLQVNCGLRIYGYGWRPHSATMKHAFRLMFKRKYGPAKLHYRFFPDFAVDRFDSIILRAQGSRSWNDFRPSIEQTCYIRDAWARYTEQAMGKLTTSSTYVHLYLNGLYWGLYNPVERPDAEFLSEHLGGAEEDYDSLNARVGQIEVIDGSRKTWDDLIAMARTAQISTLAGYQAVQEIMDVPDLIDYLLINFYTGNQDWVGSNGNNMRVAGGPGALGGYKCFCWDMEYSIWAASDNVLGVLTSYNTPALLHARLVTNPEYRLAFADRVQKHLFHDGALTPTKTAERWLARAAEIDRAVVGESARWGDRRREPPYTRDVEWVRERNRLTTAFFPQRTGVLLSQLTVAGLYPKVKAPELSQPGGVFPAGFHLVMSAPAGDVLYSLDGSDPRLPGGSPAPGAILYQTPVALEQSTRVLARALDAGAWSALTDATFISETPPPLRITEVMYHGAPGNEAGTFSPSAFEFVEVQNVGAQPLALAGMRLRGGVEFDFSAGSMPSLEPGGFALVVENVNALEARYGPGLPIAGEYSGDLSNGGEEIRLEGSFGETILDFAYDDAWAPSTDGEGRSLVIRDASAPPSAWGEEASWRESARLGGSPGRDDDSQAAAFQIPSDTNQDGRLDLSDAVSLLGHLFLGAPAVLACGDGSLADPGNHALLNANGDPKVDLADVIYVLAYLYLGGAPPILGSQCREIAGCPAACSP